MRLLPFMAFAVAACASCDPADSSPCEAGAKAPGTSLSLFNGTDLTGWSGDPSVWRVESGTIVGRSSEPVSANTFLIHEGTFDDFVLTVDVRLPQGGNSGIQYRSTVVDASQWVVHGYQADVTESLPWHMYEEGLGRGILMYAGPECTEAIRVGDWNTYEIEANGCSLVQRINGVVCTEFGEGAADRPKSGVVALQYHTPGQYEVQFRNLSIAPLD